MQLGEGYGFRKVRQALGVTAFGVNALVFPPALRRARALPRHAGRALLRPPRHGDLRVDGEEHVVGEGGLVHVESTTPRQRLEPHDDDLVLLIVGGKGGYVERDGQLVAPEDLAKRQGFEGS